MRLSFWSLRKKKQRNLDDPKQFRRRHPEYAIGRGTYGTPNILSWGEGARLEIGAYCSIAEDVRIFLGGEHRMDWVTTYPFNVFWESGKSITGHPHTKGNVVIGNDVWIASNALILSGAHIGDGAVIGAGAVISKEVPPYAIMAGNPAKLVRYRFDDATIDRLLRVAWWNWDHERIAKALPLMLSSDIQAFLEWAEQQN